VRPSRAGLAAVLLTTAGCARPSIELTPTPRPADSVYTCVQLELGRANYTIVGADHASGWVHAQRTDSNILRTRFLEIYATVIPNEGSDGSHLQLTGNVDARSDAERIRAVCAPSTH